MLLESLAFFLKFKKSCKKIITWKMSKTLNAFMHHVSALFCQRDINLTISQRPEHLALLPLNKETGPHFPSL